VADSLSRKEEETKGSLCATCIPQFDWVENTMIKWKEDKELCKIVQKLHEDPNSLDIFV
jgi:hypothetical protein